MKWQTKFKLFQISTYAIVFLTIGLMAFLTGKYIETVGLFVGFVWFRYAFDKTYHSNSFWLCILISVIVFVIAIIFIPNKHISILTCIIFGLIIDYIAYKIKDYNDLKLSINEYTKPKIFSTDSCNEDELVERCKELRLSEDNTNLAIEFFIKKTKQSILADRLGINEKSVQIHKKRLKQKLNKTI